MPNIVLPISALIFLFSFCSLPAQSTDSLVRYHELTFTSDFEKQVFDQLRKQPDYNDALALLLASYPAVNQQMHRSVESQVRHTLDELKGKGLGKSNAKTIKAVYGTVHNQFLKKYELENNFGEIFANGNYNCVSASALYGVVLSGLDIPFSVKETPNHIYLVAYPQTDKILIESTDPATGYLQLSDEFINNYLERMMKAKLISKVEYESAQKTELFNKYFFSREDDIKLKQLAGLQYYNLGLYAISEEKHREAMQHFSKAYLLYPCDRISYMLEYTITYLASQSKYTQPEDAQYLVRLSRFNTRNTELVERKLLKGEFGRITEAQLIDRNDLTLYENTFQYLRKEVKDTALLKEMEFIYQYEVARTTLNSGKTAGVLERLDRAYQLNPQNVEVQAMITNHLYRRTHNMVSYSEVLTILEPYLKNYPFLAENQQVSSMQGNCLLGLASQHFMKNQLAKGEAYLLSFEKSVSGKTPYAEESFVTRAYIEASSAYFRAGNKAKCKQTLQKGLQLSPGNFMLQDRLSQLQ